MGKQRRQRTTFHTSSKNKNSYLNNTEELDKSMDSLNTSPQFIVPDNLFANVNIDVSTIKKSLGNDCQSVKSFKSTKSEVPKGRLDGKVAVVTASTDGIGYAIAKRLAQEGANVVISSRKQKNVDKAVAELKCDNLNVTGLVCHIGKDEDRKNLIETAIKCHGGLDILVSNAAANPAVGPVLDCEEEIWDKIFDINVKASYLIAKEALPHIRKQGGGSIVFVASIAGYNPFDLLGAYSVSKTALLGLTKAAAQQVALENINVNCIAPGIIKTKFSSALTDSDANEASLSTIPMRRFGEVEDIAGVAAFLVSNDARYITGETIVPAGGMISRL